MNLLDIASLIGVFWALVCILVILSIELFTKGSKLPSGAENYGEMWKKVQKRKKYLLYVNIGVLVVLIILTIWGIFIK